nr:MAG TPA: hypothetical protein [Caudoviricetes sp.]
MKYLKTKEETRVYILGRLREFKICRISSINALSWDENVLLSTIKEMVEKKEIESDGNYLTII